MGDKDGGWVLSLVGGSTLTMAAQRADSALVRFPEDPTYGSLLS